jgi:hypothetical protein
VTVRYTGMKHHIPRYACHRGLLDNGEPRCIAFGGLRVDDPIEAAVLKVVEPGAIAAAIAAEAEVSPARSGPRSARTRSGVERRRILDQGKGHGMAFWVDDLAKAHVRRRCGADCHATR